MITVESESSTQGFDKKEETNELKLESSRKKKMKQNETKTEAKGKERSRQASRENRAPAVKQGVEGI